jgi:hypothetical protein
LPFEKSGNEKQFYFEEKLVLLYFTICLLTNLSLHFIIGKHENPGGVFNTWPGIPLGRCAAHEAHFVFSVITQATMLLNFLPGHNVLLFPKFQLFVNYPSNTLLIPFRIL